MNAVQSAAKLELIYCFCAQLTSGKFDERVPVAPFSVIKIMQTVSIDTFDS